ncbi:hypothetical protein E2C01_039106 [Portunus trituberculatus]|uniref:Uncharacterized protein n=1 Tax=Portunus trituberculatus TaxID=210409 RepID=A0A5B7FKA3_PORTR|nr:hypothetical protein [Portunus trituberculatus]
MAARRLECECRVLHCPLAPYRNCRHLKMYFAVFCTRPLCLTLVHVRAIACLSLAVTRVHLRIILSSPRLPLLYGGCVSAVRCSSRQTQAGAASVVCLALF